MIIVFIVLNSIFAISGILCIAILLILLNILQKGYLNSDVNRLIHGMDFRAEICGTDKYLEK